MQENSLLFVFYSPIINSVSVKLVLGLHVWCPFGVHPDPKIGRNQRFRGKRGIDGLLRSASKIKGFR
jgi:hypothetical protein